MTTKAIAIAIAKANARYTKATPAQRRVLIAKDAIAQLKAERFVAEEGAYTRINSPQSCDLHNDPLQATLHHPDATCECCGVGAIFLSYVRLNNHAEEKDGHGRCDIGSITKWPSANLKSIEAAFERYGFNGTEQKAAYFGKGYHSSHERLIAILENIITNHGLFVP